jgi:hypothetical protein
MEAQVLRGDLQVQLCVMPASFRNVGMIAKRRQAARGSRCERFNAAQVRTYFTLPPSNA